MSLIANLRLFPIPTFMLPHCTPHTLIDHKQLFGPATPVCTSLWFYAWMRWLLDPTDLLDTGVKPPQQGLENLNKETMEKNWGEKKEQFSGRQKG